MKRRMLLALAIMLMSMTNFTSEVQAQRKSKERPGMERREDRRSNVRNDKNRRPKQVVAHKPVHKEHHEPYFIPKGGRLVKSTPPHVKKGCPVPHWEGRVRRHHDGRWGYFVNGSWRYFDCYYNPYHFFAEPIPAPMPPRHMTYGCNASANDVAAGVALGTVLGCIIGSMAH